MYINVSNCEDLVRIEVHQHIRHGKVALDSTQSTLNHGQEWLIRKTKIKQDKIKIKIKKGIIG